MNNNKHQLLKPWQWRDVPIVYGACLEWIKDQYDFPFYWYRQIDNKIELVKQLSRNCGVVQDSNEWIPSQITLAKPKTISPLEEMYLDRRSWLTLGEVPYDPLDQLSTFTWGNKKVQLSFTTDGQLFSRKEWINDQITYSSAMKYNRKKDRFFASHYKNSDGVEAQKIDKSWNYLSGKPLTGKYGKHK